MISDGIIARAADQCCLTRAALKILTVDDQIIAFARIVHTADRYDQFLIVFIGDRRRGSDLAQSFFKHSRTVEQRSHVGIQQLIESETFIAVLVTAEHLHPMIFPIGILFINIADAESA